MLWPYCINCITAAILNCQDMLFIRSCAYRDWMVVPLVRWFWSYHHCSHLHSFFPNLICSIWRVSSPVPFTFQIFIFYPLYLIFFISWIWMGPWHQYHDTFTIIQTLSLLLNLKGGFWGPIIYFIFSLLYLIFLLSFHFEGGLWHVILMLSVEFEGGLRRSSSPCQPGSVYTGQPSLALPHIS